MMRRLRRNEISHLLAMILLLLAPATHAATKTEVSITRVRDRHGPDDYFEAKIGAKTLWKRQAVGRIYHDPESGFWALPNFRLLLVNRYGRIIKSVDLQAAFDPRILLFGRRRMVYDSGALMLAAYDPKTEGVHLWHWLHDVKQVHFYDLRKLRETHVASQEDIGMPVACSGGRLFTLKILNLKQCLRDGKKREKVALVERDFKDGHALRWATLSSTGIAPGFFVGKLLSFDPFEPATVHWSGGRVVIDNIYGMRLKGKSPHATHHSKSRVSLRSGYVRSG